jgi:ADP-heptose:LPS heptosyltransferase
MQNKLRILISRTDSIGDVVLTLPVAGVLKKKFPDAYVVFLGRNYTKDVVQTSSFVDEFISLDELQKLSEAEQLKRIHALQLTHCIHVFPKKEVAQLVKKAKVPVRIGTTNRAWHWFTCNKLIRFSRKKSDLHESQLNMKLLSPFGIHETTSLAEMPQYYGFKAKGELPAEIKDLLSTTHKNVILHPKSQGSGREWGFENFGRLIELLPASDYKVFVSGTEKEKPLLQPLLDKYPGVTDLSGKMNLEQFIVFIDAADALVAASTGPLHIAAALGKYAVGLFPSVRPMHPGRWQPVGKHAHVVMMKEDCETCKDRTNCICNANKEAEEVKTILEQIRK